VRLRIKKLLTMKKSILLVLCMATMVTAVLTSCKKDNDTVSFRATISSYQNTGKDSKVYIDANRYANWHDQDELIINGANYTLEVSQSDGNQIASINGVPVVTDDNGGYYAFYPAEKALTTPATGFPEILLPQVQIYRNDNPDNPAQGNQIVEAPMAAYCPASQTPATLNFTNLCALLKIELDEAMEVGYITVSSSNKPLWGKATITGTTTPTLSAPNISEMYSTDNTVTLDCTALGLHGPNSDASAGVTSAGPFYIVLPPATGVEGLTVNVYVFTGASSSSSRRTVLKYSKTTTNTVPIAANNLYVTGDLPEEGEVVPDAPFPHLSTGEFSVSRSKKVRFALGNLQYQASTGTWRFAEKQYDRIGNAAGNNVATGRSTQTAWIDLFGFGTSGVNYNPWATSTYNTPDNNNPYARGHINNTVNDWGVNEICNGGNQPNKWRTLTEAEWKYLLGQGGSIRPNASNLHIPVVYIKITNSNQIRGTMIFPDGYTGSKPYSNDRITLAQWRTYEAAGAVFLPPTGHRSGTTVNALTTGYYWTSTFETYEDAKTRGRQVYFDGSGDHVGYDYTYMGNAVRLVRDVN
jgi:hypothetical protein